MALKAGSCLRLKFLRTRGLEVSPEKTRVTHIDEGFDFLGFNFRKYKGKLLIKPSKASVHSPLERVRDLIKAHKPATQTEFAGKAQSAFARMGALLPERGG